MNNKATEAPERYWVELRTQHAFEVKPDPHVETVEYLRHPRYTHKDDQRLQELFDSLPDIPTEEQAEEVLQACGTSGKEVVNGFIDRLLRENLEMKQKLDRIDPPAAPTGALGHCNKAPNCSFNYENPSRRWCDCKCKGCTPPAPDEADKALAQHCLAIDQLRASGCNVTLWCTPRAVVTQITFHDEDASPDIDKSFATLREAIEFAAASKQER